MADENPNDPEVNARKFAEAVQVQRRMSARSFGAHEGGIMVSDTAEPQDQPDDAEVTADDKLDQAMEPLTVQPTPEVPAYEPQFLDVMARRGKEQFDPISDPSSQSVHAQEYTPEHASDYDTPHAPTEITGSLDHEPDVVPELPDLPVETSEPVQPAPVPMVVPLAQQPQVQQLPKFIRNLGMKERPIMDDANPNEPPAANWRQEQWRAPQQGLDLGGKPIERQQNSNERVQQEQFIEIGESLDDFGIAQEGFAMSVVQSIKQLTHKITRMSQSLSSEGEDGE